MDNNRKMLMKKRRTITLILLGIFFVGLFVLLYPAFANFWNQKTQSQAVVDYDAYLESLTEEDYSAIFEEADEYNRALAQLGFPLTDYTELGGYYDLVNVGANGMFGYIDIDKIQVKLPIYHGTSASVLNSACGHLQGSSLPVGGTGTHCVLSAHRGLPTAKLFTNLDKLEIGDTFKLTVLDRVLTYRVDQILIVKPNEIDTLAIDENMDYCTLLTCTPYGINTHRLLVRGVRVENEEQIKTSVSSEAYLVDRLIVTPIVALPILFVLILYVFFMPTKRKLPLDDEEE